MGRLRRAQQEREAIQNALDVRGGGGAKAAVRPEALTAKQLNATQRAAQTTP